MRDQYLTLREVVERLRISRSTLHRWRAQGRIQAYRIGPRTVRYRASEVEALERGIA